MADDASRLFELSDAELLTHFNAVCPQMNHWRLARPIDQDAFLGDLCRAQEASRAGIVSSQANPNNKTWVEWGRLLPAWGPPALGWLTASGKHAFRLRQ